MDTPIGKCVRDIETDFHCEQAARCEWGIDGQVQLERDFLSDSHRVESDSHRVEPDFHRVEYDLDGLRDLEFVRVLQHGREWVGTLLQDTDLPSSLDVAVESKYQIKNDWPVDLKISTTILFL